MEVRTIWKCSRMSGLNVIVRIWPLTRRYISMLFNFWHLWQYCYFMANKIIRIRTELSNVCYSAAKFSQGIIRQSIPFLDFLFLSLMDRRCFDSTRWGFVGKPRRPRQPTPCEAWCTPSLVTDSFFQFAFCHAILFCSSQQLPHLHLGPLKGFLSWHGAFNGPSTRRVCYFQN